MTAAHQRRLVAAVALASAGRPGLLADVVENLRAQTEPFVAVMSVPDADSVPPSVASSTEWTVVTGSKGLAVQRNTALDVVGTADIVFFFDDDSVVRDDYIANAIDYFESNPHVVGITGRVLLDGAVRGEVPIGVANDAIAASSALPLSGSSRRTRELYGCNFAVRMSVAGDLRFDGRLPLYSWLEDHDFARRLMRRGSLAHVDDCVIVHRAASSGGRQAHTRLGYSQMMNPIYLWRKGSFPAWLMMYEIVPRTSKNLVLSIAGRQSKWRRERTRGNLLGLADALRGRITPERISSL